MIVRGRLPAGRPPEDESLATAPAGRIRSIFRRLRRLWPHASESPALVAYVRAYESVVERMLPPAPLTRLERLSSDLYDGRMAPSAAFFTMVTTAATILSQHLSKAADLLNALQPPAEAERAFRRLLSLHEAAELATGDVLEAAARGEFDTLQDSLLELTREVAVLRRSVDVEHRRLARAVTTGEPFPVLPKQSREELPSNVIPLIRTGKLNRY